MKKKYYVDYENGKDFIVQFKFFKRKLAVLQSCSLAVLLKFCLKEKIKSNQKTYSQTLIRYLLFLMLLTYFLFPYYTQSRKLFCGGSV